MASNLLRFRPGMAVKVGLLAAGMGLTLQPGASHAQQAPGDSISCPVSLIGTAQCNGGNPLIVGDKLLDQFDFTGLVVDPLDIFTITQVTANAYQFQYTFTNPERSNSAGRFSYRVSITPAGLAAGNVFDTAQANITGSTFTSTASFTTNVVSSAPLSLNPLLAGSASSGRSNPSDDGTFGPNVVSTIFEQSFIANGGSNNAVINSLGVTLTQKLPPPKTEVPGPLPIFGAGAAFGLSRKLRRRMKQLA